MTSWPKISVVIVTRNRAANLKKTLDRILEDDYPDRELIVVDGASTDGTVDLLRSYGDRITRFVSEPDSGEYDAWNKAIRMATGDILKPVPDDDLLRPGALRLAAGYFAAHPDVGILFGQSQVWDGRGAELVHLKDTFSMDPERTNLHHWLRQTHGLNSIAAFIRSDVYRRIGLYRTDFTAGDTEFWVRAASRGVRFGLVPDVVVDYVVTGKNLEITKSFAIAWDVVRVNAAYGSVADVLYTLWQRRWTLSGYHELVARTSRVSHRFGLHPRQALDRALRRAGIRR
jgi:glycosyltransferase involved in cell wall biosynthesis